VPFSGSPTLPSRPILEMNANLFIYSGIPMTKKKFAELELSLLHLQQNVEIPETHLIVHPIIQRAVEQVCLHFSLFLCTICRVT